ncbi:hypothetical protein ACS0TY_009992 [Phlomoides rotata]
MALLLLIGKIHICKCKKGKGHFFMVKNSSISVISQKENKETRGSVEFQVFSFTTKIRKLTSHLELHKKDFL